MMREGYLWNRKWLWILILVAAAVILSYMKPLKLEEGGEVGARRSSLFRRSTLTTRSMRSRMGPEMRLW